MSSKDWTMNCILTGVEIARLLRKKRAPEATLYLGNLTSELTSQDIEYLMMRANAILAKEEE